MGPARKRPRTNTPFNQTSSKTATDELKSIAVQIPLPETPSNGSCVDPLEETSATRKTSQAESNGKVGNLNLDDRALANVSFVVEE